MTLGEEIEYVIATMAKDKNTALNVQDIIGAFKAYIGIGSDGVMTMDAICLFYNLPVTKGTLSNNFRSYFTEGIDKVSTVIVEQICRYIDKITICNIRDFCINLNQITGENICYKGYKNFLKFINRDNKLSVIDINFNEVNNDNNEDKYLVLDKCKLNDFIAGAKKFKTSITEHGLILVEEAKKCKIDELYLDSIISIYKSNQKYVEVTGNDQLKWMMLENDDNVIINSLRKIVPYAEKQSVEVLADILFRAAQRTTKYTKAKIDVYIKYLKKTSYLNIDEWKLNVNKEMKKESNFAKYDIAILRYFAEDLSIKEVSFVDLKKYFFISGENDASIKKISWSTVVKRCGNRRNYIYEPIFSKEFISKYFFYFDVDDLVNSSIENETFGKFIPLNKTPKKAGTPINVQGKKVFLRERKISKNALIRAKHKCEYNSEHYVFIRLDGITGYTEPHHLFPMEFQNEYTYSLDREQNIVSLCSSCHNLIHYGAGKKELITILYEKRKEELYEIGIKGSLEELLKLYNV